MDTMKLAILAFVAGGIVLSFAKVSPVQAILISAVAMTIITVIAVIRYKVDPPKKNKPPTDKGPSIK